MPTNRSVTALARMREALGMVIVISAGDHDPPHCHAPHGEWDRPGVGRSSPDEPAAC